MNIKTGMTALFFSTVISLFGQSIKRIDGTKFSADSLNAKIQYLMKVANVSGVGVSVFNDNKPIFNKDTQLDKE